MLIARIINDGTTRQRQAAGSLWKYKNRLKPRVTINAINVLLNNGNPFDRGAERYSQIIITRILNSMRSLIDAHAIRRWVNSITFFRPHHHRRLPQPSKIEFRRVYNRGLQLIISDVRTSVSVFTYVTGFRTFPSDLRSPIFCFSTVAILQNHLFMNSPPRLI